jgi:FixJ family two-component response regulator
MNDGGHHRIAVVDDDPRILESLQDMLESAGYAVQVYPTAAALLTSGIANIDALITDVGLPMMDGFELRDHVKLARPELPVILISGRRDLASVQSIDSRGYAEFFRKPFDGQALLAAIGQALQLTHLQPND